MRSTVSKTSRIGPRWHTAFPWQGGSERAPRLAQTGVTGVTISDVKEFGRTGGHREVYRGSAYFVDFVPKVRIEILVKDEMLHDVVALIAETARTGRIGDGKILV